MPRNLRPLYRYLARFRATTRNASKVRYLKKHGTKFRRLYRAHPASHGLRRSSRRR